MVEARRRSIVESFKAVNTTRRTTTKATSNKGENRVLASLLRSFIFFLVMRCGGRNEPMLTSRHVSAVTSGRAHGSGVFAPRRSSFVVPAYQRTQSFPERVRGKDLALLPTLEYDCISSTGYYDDSRYFRGTRPWRIMPVTRSSRRRPTRPPRPTMPPLPSASTSWSN